MEEILQNTGYLHREIQPDDWVFGSATQIPYQNRNTLHNWQQFLTPGEKQFGTKGDMMDCISFAEGQSIDAQVNFLRFSKLINDSDWQKLDDLGFIMNGQFVCSKRGIAKMSSTTKSGNSFQQVADSVRTKGLLPEKDLPSDPLDMSWDEYYRILSAVELTKAEEILKIFTFPYHQLSDLSHTEIEKALQMAPVQIGTACCPIWSSGDIKTCLNDPTHATLVYDVEDATKKVLILDHYEPFLKKLAPDYKIWAAIQTVVSPVVSVEPESFLKDGLLHHDIVFGQVGDEVVKLKGLLSNLGWKTKTGNVYDAELADTIFNFQLANISRVFFEMILSLKGKKVGPLTRGIINKGKK